MGLYWESTIIHLNTNKQVENRLLQKVYYESISKLSSHGALLGVTRALNLVCNLGTMIRVRVNLGNGVHVLQDQAEVVW